MIAIIAAKTWVEQATALPDSTLHMAFGTIALLMIAAALRRPFWNWRPWIGLFILELFNEANDLLSRAAGEATLGASLHDIWATMLVPSLLLVFAPMVLRRAGVDTRPRRSGDGLQ